MANERHKYDYETGLDSDSGPSRVIRIVGQNKRVLEVGSGPGSITKLLASESGCRVTALDIDAISLESLAPYCDRVCQADLNDPAWTDALGIDDKFEVLVAADVLEHVHDPLTVLKSMTRCLAERGYMVISIPHVGHSVVHACLLDEDFDYGDFGLLDRTHIRFFGIRNMQKLFDDADLKIVHAEFVIRNPEHTEFANRWSKVPPAVRSALEVNAFGTVYQVVVKVARHDSDDKAISLMDLPVSRRKATARDSLRAMLRTCLSTKSYTRLRALASKMGLRFRG
jgi:2-polyprenyl-3-methyl-5-hydroxy-6-metoxy-1,4-benzoquinol methylase